MTCEETRQSLSSYVDDCVSLSVRVAIDEHLDRCPVCRAEVAELRALTRSLSLMTRPVAPADLAVSISDLLTIEAAARRQAPPSWSYRILRFLEPRLMPYTVGSFASVIMFFLMLTALRPHFVALREASIHQSGVFVLGIKPVYDLYSTEDFARSESPSLNPEGKLAALTSGHAHEHTGYAADADDMIVVANVFSNGSASLAEVVTPPRDKRMLDEFESALRQDYAFVPASVDRRPDTMRVVLSFVQRVDVDERQF